MTLFPYIIEPPERKTLTEKVLGKLDDLALEALLSSITFCGENLPQPVLGPVVRVLEVVGETYHKGEAFCQDVIRSLKDSHTLMNDYFNDCSRRKAHKRF